MCIRFRFISFIYSVWTNSSIGPYIVMTNLSFAFRLFASFIAFKTNIKDNCFKQSNMKQPENPVEKRNYIRRYV